MEKRLDSLISNSKGLRVIIERTKLVQKTILHDLKKLDTKQILTSQITPLIRSRNQCLDESLKNFKASMIDIAGNIEVLKKKMIEVRNEKLAQSTTVLGQVMRPAPSKLNLDQTQWRKTLTPKEVAQIKQSLQRYIKYREGKYGGFFTQLFRNSNLTAFKVKGAMKILDAMGTTGDLTAVS